MALPMPIITNDNIRNMVRNYCERRLRDVPIGEWDVSRVTNMAGLFKDIMHFNEPLENWDVSNVVDMSNMFERCFTFNQPLNAWNVSNVRNMKFMFSQAYLFNQPWMPGMYQT